MRQVSHAWYSAHMTKDELSADLARLAQSQKLSAFAQATGVNRRTLQRIAAGGNPQPATLAHLSNHLRKAKWLGVGSEK